MDEVRGWGSGPGLEGLHGLRGEAEEAIDFFGPGLGGAAFAEEEGAAVGGGEYDGGDGVGG